MASADSMGISHPVCTERLMCPTAMAALLGGQNWRAYSITFSMKPSRSKMSLMMPISLASSKEKVLPAGQHLPEKVRQLYTQITEWQGGDKSQHWRSPNTSSPELLGPGKSTKHRPNCVCASEDYPSA